MTLYTQRFELAKLKTSLEWRDTPISLSLDTLTLCLQRFELPRLNTSLSLTLVEK